MTIEEIRGLLDEKAETRFGPKRAEELRADIEQVAGDIFILCGQSLRIEDEP